MKVEFLHPFLQLGLYLNISIDTQNTVSFFTISGNVNVRTKVLYNCRYMLHSNTMFVFV